MYNSEALGFGQDNDDELMLLHLHPAIVKTQHVCSATGAATAALRATLTAANAWGCMRNDTFVSYVSHVTMIHFSGRAMSATYQHGSVQYFTICVIIDNVCHRALPTNV